MKLLSFISITIVICAVTAQVLQTKEQLIEKAKELEALLEKAALVIRSNPNLNQNDLRVINQQDATLKLLVIQLDGAKTPAEVEAVEKQLIDAETTIQNEVAKLEAIIAAGGPTPAPVNKEDLIKRAKDLEKLLEQALTILKVHPLINLRELLALDSQDINLRVLVAELQEATITQQLNVIESRLISIERTVESEVNRLNEIIKSGQTISPTGGPTPLPTIS